MSAVRGQGSFAFETNENITMQAETPSGPNAQLLDLTYRAGGESANEMASASVGDYSTSYDAEGGATSSVSHADEHHFEDDNSGAVPAGDASLMSSEGGSPRVHQGRNRGFALDPSTPGRIVETGQEHTGRWTREEHAAFLQGLKMYGKEWKKVAAKVKTRTVVQTRTHAQKYFQKLQKSVRGPRASTGSGDDDDMPDIDVGTLSSDSKKATAAAAVSLSTSTTVPHLDPNLSMPTPGKASGEPRKTKIKVKSFPGPVLVPSTSSAMQTPNQPISRGVAVRTNSTISAAHVISTLSSSKPPVGSFRVSNSSTMLSAGEGVGPLPPPRHGFSTDIVHPATSVDKEWSTSAARLPMKIVAPDPSASMSVGNFPEPSPAATGKRKLAEIAAARMLAGVFGGVPQQSAIRIKPPPSWQSMAAPSSADLDDGPPTPPPQSSAEYIQQPFRMENAPLPPFMAAGSSAGKSSATNNNKFTLQIVNPETLGVSYNLKRRRADGENSPVTPWDGQLEALMNEKSLQNENEELTESESNFDAGKKTTGEGATSLCHNRPSDNGAISANGIHPICNPQKSCGRTALHQAICDMNIDALRVQLSHDAMRSDISVLHSPDDAGYFPIHSACALGLGLPPTARSEGTVSSQARPIDFVRMLLSAGDDASRADAHGNTPLHWAARAGDKEVAEQLLLKSCPLDARNHKGATALHFGMRAGIRSKDVVTMFLSHGARTGILDKSFQRPLDVACEGFLDEAWSIVSIRAREAQGGSQQRGGVKSTMSKELRKALKEILGVKKEVRTNFLIHSSQSRTLVLHHPECLEHHTKSASDWEAPDRVRTIMKRILPSTDTTGATETSGIFPHEVTVSKDFDKANLDLLSRVHSTEYLSFVNKLSKDLEKRVKESNAGTSNDGSADNDENSKSPQPPPVVPFTPMVQRSMIKIDESDVKLGINSDTSFSAGSLRAARRAAGAVQHAVDCVLVGRNRNAFCVVRPPGHHAGINGLLEGGESCGFCIFNNVAAGALYAIQEDRLLCERCAIVDIDVHHGNGTEEIVRKCSDPSKLFFFSIHLYDNDKKKRNPNQFVYKFYPGTGFEDDLALNIINVPIVPLWKDQPQAPPQKTHNTRNKVRSEASAQDDSSEASNNNQRAASRLSDGPSDNGASSNRFATSNLSSAGSSMSGRAAYREAIRNRLLPALRAFNPDLILISTGFDALKGDVGNARHERGGRERMGLDLEPEDYAWTTRKILEIADICCQGRVVSVLEGGYGRTPIVQNHDAPDLDRSLLGECAVRHLHALIDPYDAENRFSSL